MSTAENIDTRLAAIAEYEHQNPGRGFMIPEVANLGDLFEDVKVYVSKPGQSTGRVPGVYISVPSGGYRVINGNQMWVAMYGKMKKEFLDCVQTACSEGQLQAVKLIEWPDGYGLVVGTDINHIANPFIALVDVEDSEHWYAAQIDKALGY